MYKAVPRDRARFARNLFRDRYLILMVIPAFIIVIMFSYIPMSGLAIAFSDYSSARGIFGGPWVGLKHFKAFFGSMFFPRLMRNTVLLSVYTLVIGFPIPIIFALLLNEVKANGFKRVVQTISYMPHFVSLVVVVALINSFFRVGGMINNYFIEPITGQSINFLSDPAWFRTLYVGSEIWQHFGWNSIIFIAAIAGVNPELYESALIDGAGRWKQCINITLPSIMPTIMVVFIMNCGWIMSIGFEKIILMYEPSIYDTADVISTFVYRKGILGAQFSYATAVGFFNSVINMIILLVVNRLSAKINDISLI